MKIIIHDLSQQELDELHIVKNEDTTIIGDIGTIRNCIGCFGCWIKTPGMCVIKDGYQDMGKILAKCHEMIIISKCLYGSYSPFILNVLNRSNPYILPYFATKKGETHHKNRYDNTFSLSVYFYGDDITKAEKATAEKLVKANGVNFYSNESKVFFYDSLNNLKEVFK